MPPRKAGVGGEERPERPASSGGPHPSDKRRGVTQVEQPAGLRRAVAGLGGSDARTRYSGRPTNNAAALPRRHRPAKMVIRQAIVTSGRDPQGARCAGRAEA